MHRQGFVKSLGFKNSMFIIDDYHLKKSGLQDHFTVNGYEILREHLHHLIKGKSEVIFNSVADSAHDLLK